MTNADRRGAWIPYAIIGVFLFLFMLLGNFVRIALTTFNGTVAEHPYETGLAYNRELAARARVTGEGLVPALNVQRHGDTIFVSLLVRDSRGNAALLSHARVRIIRPTKAGMDLSVPMQMARGSATAQAILPAPGLWDVVVSAQADGVPVQIVRRLVP